MSPPVEFISFAKKEAIEFCYFFSVIEGTVLNENYEIKNIGHRVRFRENKHLFLCRA